MTITVKMLAKRLRHSDLMTLAPPGVLFTCVLNHIRKQLTVWLCVVQVLKRFFWGRRWWLLTSFKSLTYTKQMSTRAPWANSCILYILPLSGIFWSNSLVYWSVGSHNRHWCIKLLSSILTTTHQVPTWQFCISLTFSHIGHNYRDPRASYRD